LELQSQAEQVFGREAFKHVMWVGIHYSKLTRDMLPKPFPLDIVIFYDPRYPENQIWESYKSCEGIHLSEDPDKSKLERAWGRMVRILRIYEGTLLHWNDVEAVFHAETLYGDFNNPVLRNFRSFYCHKINECQRILGESALLVENLRISKESMSSSEVSQQAYRIAGILATDTWSPLLHLVELPRGRAEILWKTSSHDPAWPESLKNLSDRLFYSKALAGHYAQWAEIGEGRPNP
jgi:hypothetical protein